MLLAWILQGLLAAAFLFHGLSKLVGMGFQRRIFRSFGLPPWSRLAVGAAESLGAVLILIPATVVLAAAGLAILLVGIFAAHVVIERAPHHGVGALLHLGLVAAVLWLHL